MRNKDLTNKVDFTIIRYANCWEDADILLQGLSPAEGNKILSVGSAGDNSFSLLTTNPEIIVAIDINKIQLYVIELKKAAIKKLDYKEVLQFLGFTPCEKRIELFDSIKSELNTEAVNYWSRNLRTIHTGIIYSGKFEKYFTMFSKHILPLIHSKKTVAKLFSAKTKKEQEIFYDGTWNSWKWKLLFKMFFSRYLLGKLGRDPEFLKEVTVPVSQTIYHKAAIQLRSEEAQNNFILNFCLTGHFGGLLPHYLQRQNFEVIKKNIARIVIKEGFAQEAIHYYGKFQAMNLSNIFEYMETKKFTAVAGALLQGMEENGKMGYWNLMVPRKISNIFPGKVYYEKELSDILTRKDKGFFYNEFIIDRVK